MMNHVLASETLLLRGRYKAAVLYPRGCAFVMERRASDAPRTAYRRTAQPSPWSAPPSRQTPRFGHYRLRPHVCLHVSDWPSVEIVRKIRFVLLNPQVVLVASYLYRAHLARTQCQSL